MIDTDRSGGNGVRLLRGGTRWIHLSRDVETGGDSDLQKIRHTNSASCSSACAAAH